MSFQLSHSLQGKLGSGGKHVAPRPAFLDPRSHRGFSFGRKSLYGKIHVSFQNKLTPQEEWKSFAKLSGPLEYLRENTYASVGVGLLP